MTDPAPIPTAPAGPLDRDEARLIHAWWRAANYLSVGQIYLLANPLLRRPLSGDDIKPRLLGHWGTTPGLTFIHAHANRVIRARDLDAIEVIGPGHGGPAAVAAAWMEGSYTELYPSITQDAEGMRRLFRQFSFPGGIGSHVTPETPGSLHEGGELGYSLVHAYGAAFDDPGLVVFCVVGDGEAETGPLAASWHATKFVDPVRDGVVVPILHLNGYKIANPTLLARIPDEELKAFFVGHGYRPHIVAGDEPTAMHQRMAAVMDTVMDEVAAIQKAAREDGVEARPAWPMVVLRSPKGWTGPREVDGLPAEGSFRSHQVPLAGMRENPEHLAQLEAWMRSYAPEELFNEAGFLHPEIAALAPVGQRRMTANPRTNGGLVRRDLDLPDFRDYAVDVPSPGRERHEATRVMGQLLRDVIDRNPSTFRVFGPDETASNRLAAVFEVTDRVWAADLQPTDQDLARSGRVVEVLSEHLCQGFLEGYLLTGRHGLFNCYEAFIHIIDSMFNQHAKWLKMIGEIPWRAPIASLNYLLTSHVWRQDHNGFSHQDPGFIDHVINKKAEHIRVYLPPDANTLLSTTDHILRSTNYVNVVVAGKQPSLDYLGMEEAILHCTRGLGIWDWASNDDGDPDVVMAACGDVPTMEALAAVDLMRQHLPDLRVRFINVVDLMRLQDEKEHPHGLSHREFDALFTVDKPIVFAYHGYPWLIHRLTYRRHNHANLHVRGYKEEGTVTTPFDMVMRNDLDRFHLVIDVIDRVHGLGTRAAQLRQHMVDERVRARAYANEHGEVTLDHQRMDLAGLMPHVAGDAPGTRRILVLNPGSSSLKASLLAPPETTLARTEVSWGADATRQGDRVGGLAQALGSLGIASGRSSPPAVDVVGYRVVHGGARFTAPARLDSEVIEAIRAVSDLAPLHNDVALDTIEAGRSLVPGVPHVACFDTAFHATLDEAAFRYPVPEAWFRDWGLRRFGFHGLSVAWSTRQAARLLARPVDKLGVVVAHLGSGCSVTAVSAGQSVATTMGLTPLEGLMMGTRSGSVDPGLLLHVLSRGLMTTEQLAETLDHASGLLGVSGRSGDMRDLLAAAAGADDSAALAIEMFVARAAAAIAAAATALPHLDAIVFTGGIGEHAAEVRQAVVARLAVIGVPPLPHVPEVADRDARLDAGDGPVAVLRIEAREDLVIAQQSLTLVQGMVTSQAPGR